MIKGLLLDYGGTMDTDGMHWGELLWRFYEQAAVPVSKEAFREAYVFGERSLALHPYVQAHHNFLDVLRVKLDQQFHYLQTHSLLSTAKDYSREIESIAANGDAYAKACIGNAIPVLQSLTERYPMVLVSNFYGNIEAVLQAYGIRHFFKSVVESSVVGVRKPDAKIFTLGVEALGFLPHECVAVGDSYRKDMVPAKEAGCHTIWLKGEGWEEDPTSPVAVDKIVKSFSELPSALLEILS